MLFTNRLVKEDFLKSRFKGIEYLGPKLREKLYERTAKEIISEGLTTKLNQFS